MSWHNLFLHDLRCGLLRRRYLLVPLLMIFPFLDYLAWAGTTNTSGTWMDFILFLFQGNEVLNISELAQFFTQIPMPLSWLLVMGAGLVLDLDYFLQDLSLIGQQIITRCGKRTAWFLSKCVWSFLSSVLYMVILVPSGCVYTLLGGGALSLHYTPEILHMVFGEYDALGLTVQQAVMIGIVVPFFTLAAFHMLQMTLCTFLKPIASFLICMGILILSIYLPHPWALGNGAMTIRSVFFENGCIYPGSALAWACVILAACVLVGSLGFKRADLIPVDE